MGLVLGSFTTMLSYRIPRKLSIVTPPSYCPRCNAHLKARDLVPVFSWLFEGGKCRQCQQPISPRYLLIELATTVLCTTCFVTIGFAPQLVPALIGSVAFVTLVTINLEKQRSN